jgi:tetratricopeptide (TPR) repeat protein
MFRSAAICIGLLVSTWLVYGPTRDFDFVSYDDPDYVTENSDITLGLSAEGLTYALTTPVMGFYHPITMLSLLADYELYAFDPAGYHLGNIALHALNSLLLFGFLQYATRRTWPSAVVAALFAVHPLHVESVVWIAERKDVLSTCFGLGCLWAYAGYARSGSRHLYGLSAGLLAAGLLSKSMLVTFPVLMLLLDYWPLSRLSPPERLASPAQWWEQLRPRLVEKIPFIALAGIAALGTLWIQQQAGAMGDKAIEEGSVAFSLANLPNLAAAYARYLAMNLWPSDLAVLYPHPDKSNAGGIALTGWEIAQALLLLVLVSIAAVRVRRPAAIVGWLWFLISLLPVIGLIQIGSHFVADRYTYIPSIGLFAMVCFVAADQVERYAKPNGAVLPFTAAATVLVLAAYGLAARHATEPWRDSQSLYKQGIRVSSRNALMIYNLGNEIRAAGDVDPAMIHFKRVIEIDPGHYQAHINLGEVYAAKEQHTVAVQHYRIALGIEPEDPVANNNIGNSLNQLGQFDEALAYYKIAIGLKNGSPLPHYNLGNFMLRRQRWEEAATHYRNAIALDPGYVGAISNLGNVLLSQGKLDEAIAQYRRALALEPGEAVATSGLKIALARSAAAVSAPPQ